MKKLTVMLLSLLLVLGSILSLTPAWAAGQKWEVEADLAFNSKYVWRGMNLVDDWVIQPSLTVSRGGFSANLWANYEPTDQTGHQKKITEVDLSAQYTFELGGFSIPLGLIHYLFPNTSAPATTEVFAGVSYHWLVTPSLTIYHDLDQAHGQYLALALDYAYQLPLGLKQASLGLELGAGVGYAGSDYNQFYYGVDEAAWSDWYCSLSVPLGLLDDKLTITPRITYTALIDDELKKTTDKDTNTFFGLSVTYAF